VTLSDEDGLITVTKGKEWCVLWPRGGWWCWWLWWWWW